MDYMFVSCLADFDRVMVFFEKMRRHNGFAAFDESAEVVVADVLEVGVNLSAFLLQNVDFLRDGFQGDCVVVGCFPHCCCQSFVPDSFDDRSEDGSFDIVPDLWSFWFVDLFNRCVLN